MVMSSRSFQRLSRSALSCGQLGLGQFAHVGVGPLDHLQGVADLVVEILEAAILGGQLGQRAVLARHGRQAGRIGQHLGIDELPFQLLEAAEFFVERIRHGSSLYGAVKRATPAPSARRALHVPCSYRLLRAASAASGRRGRLLAAVQAGIAGGGELLLELLDAARRVDVLQLARVEGMADVADIDLQFGLGAAGDETCCRSRR